LWACIEHPWAVGLVQNPMIPQGQGQYAFPVVELCGALSFLVQAH
jgi:hypothetical protein